jgi:hypothetical protein
MKAARGADGIEHFPKIGFEHVFREQTWELAGLSPAQIAPF